MIDISVIIPTRNRLWSLPKAVESCRSKRLRVQIIALDDASTDGTVDWLRNQNDVTVVHGEGWGKPWGVNKAMPLATGKYLRYLDSDDWLNPGANETQFDIAEHEHADVVVAGLDIYDEETLIESQPWFPTDDFIAQQLGETPGSHYSAFLFRREFVKDIPHRTLFPASDFASRDDRCFMLEVALCQPRIAVCSTPTLCHRHHTKGRLQFQGALRGDGTNIQQLYIERQIIALLKMRGQLTERRRNASAKLLWPLAHQIGYHHLDEACEVADWLFELAPDFKPLEAGLLGWLFQRFGFRRTEQMLGFRRALIRPLRRLKQRLSR